MEKIGKKRILFYGLSLLVILAVIVWFVISTRDLPKYDYSLGDWFSENVEITDEGFTVSDSLKDTGKNTEFLWGPYKPLKRGSYTAAIAYSAEKDQIVIASDPAETDMITASKGLLSRHFKSLDYEFEVKEDTDAFSLVIGYGGTGAFAVRSVSITANNRWHKRVSSEIIFAVLLLDLGVALYFRNRHLLRTLLMLAGITALTGLPLASYGIRYGHDIMVHYLRIESVVQSLKAGQFPARISSFPLYGLGYPFSIYYNDLFLYFPAVLRLFGFSVNTAYKAYIAAVLFLTAGISYYSFGRIFGSRKTGMILTLLYMTASYHLVTIFSRAAVGEYTAQAFLPLITLALCNIYADSGNASKNLFRNALLLALGFTGLVGSHVLTVIISCFLILPVCLILWKKTLTKPVLLTYGCAAGLMLILNLYFIVPFLDYYFSVPTQIKALVDNRRLLIGQYGIQPAQLFAFFQKVTGSWQLKAHDRVQSTPGLPLMSVLMLSLYAVSRGKRNRRFLLFLGLALVTLFLATDIFPWDWLSVRLPVWNLLTQIEFPGRFLGMASLFLCLLAGELTGCFDHKKLGIGLVCAAAVMTVWFTGNLLDSEDILCVYDASGLDLTKVGGEYLLAGTDVESLNTEIDSEHMEAAEIIGRRSDQLTVYCRADDSGGGHKVFVPLFNYRGYHVYDAGGNEYPIVNGEQNHIGFSLPDGFDGELTVKFRVPSLWTAAFSVSLLAAAALLLWVFRKNIRNRLQLFRKG